jgi:ABC-type sugar transport system permease subunit
MRGSERVAQGIDAAEPRRLVRVGSGRGLSARLDRLTDGRFGALIATPGLLMVAAFVLLPIGWVIFTSLFRQELSHDSFRPFITLRNYAVRLSADDVFLGTIPRTIGFAAVATALAVPIALGTALVIHGRAGRRGAGLLGLLLLLPWAIAPIADGILWRLLFDTRSGVLNFVLGSVGLPRVDLTTAPGVLLVTLVAVVWRSIPLLGVLFLGALRQVPPELARAARTDGANGWQTLRHVTLPAIAPSVIAACLLQIVLALQVFEIQFAIVGDSPPRDSVLAGYQLYRTVIGEISLGYGAAATLVYAAITGLCVGLLWFTVTRIRRRSTSEPKPIPARAVGPAGTTALPPLPEPKPRNEAADRARAAGGRISRVVAIVAVAILLVGPIIWIAIASTQPGVALRASPPRLTTALTFEAYARLLGDRAWQGSAWNSILISTVATLIAVAVAATAAYPLARSGFRGTRAILLALLLALLIPPIALAIPVLFVFVGLGMRHTVIGLVLANAAFWIPILVWLIRGAFLHVPPNVERAARIDGASRLTTIFRVVLPAAAPAVAAAAAIAFIGIWNDFTFVAVLGGRETSTLPRYLGTSFTPSFPTLAATIVVTVLPCIALVALLRRRILGLI